MRFPAIYLRTATLAASLLAAVAHTVPAQTAARAGGGATFPRGDFGPEAETGWMGLVDFTGAVGDSRKVVVGIEGFYGRNEGTRRGFPGAVAESHAHVGAFWIGRWRPLRPHGPSPYLQLGAGAAWYTYAYECDPSQPDDICGETEYSDTEVLLGFHAAVGLDVPLGRVALWAEGRYLHLSTDPSPKYVALLAGIRAPL